MKWPVTPHTYRRWKDGTPYHCRADALENRLGDPTPTGRDSGGVPRGRLYLLARPRADARDHHSVVPLTDSARQHRVQSCAASLGLTVQRVGLLSSSRQTPPPPLR